MAEITDSVPRPTDGDIFNRTESIHVRLQSLWQKIRNAFGGRVSNTTVQHTDEVEAPTAQRLQSLDDFRQKIVDLSETYPNLKPVLNVLANKIGAGDFTFGPSTHNDMMLVALEMNLKSNEVTTEELDQAFESLHLDEKHKLAARTSIKPEGNSLLVTIDLPKNQEFVWWEQLQEKMAKKEKIQIDSLGKLILAIRAVAEQSYQFRAILFKLIDKLKNIESLPNSVNRQGNFDFINILVDAGSVDIDTKVLSKLLNSITFAADVLFDSNKLAQIGTFSENNKDYLFSIKVPKEWRIAERGFLLPESEMGTWTIVQNEQQAADVTNAIIIPTATNEISKGHATLVRENNNGEIILKLINDDPLNGTFVNEERLTANEIRDLQEGDLVKFSTVAFVVKNANLIPQPKNQF